MTNTGKTLSVIAGLSLVAVAGCASKTKNATARAERLPASPVERDPERTGAAEISAVSAEGNEVLFVPILFDYDSSEIRSEYRDVLARLADHMRGRDLRLAIEGHCDERGTVEYNLALGERRARAIKEYLVDLGVDRRSVSVISYGEERPADAGSGESAWAQNRRGELVPDQGEEY